MLCCIDEQIIYVQYDFCDAFMHRRLSGLENGLLGLNSRVNAVMWSRSVNDIESMDIFCFGHLLFEMCTGYELNAPQPTAGHLQLDLEKYPQVISYIVRYLFYYKWLRIDGIFMNASLIIGGGGSTNDI